VTLADSPVPVRQKLSALWASVMFCYVYGDIFGLFRPGKLAALLDGRTPLGPTTQGILVAFAAVMAIPSVMVALSLLLPPTLARWANIIFGVAYTIVIVLSIRGAWNFYLMLAGIEAALTIAVTWYAWTWPRQE
jgi:hypothetical protein